MGQHTVIVKEVRSGGKCGRGSVMHIADRRSDILAYIGFGQRAVFNKLVHLHAVSKGFMSDQAGDGRIGDDIIDTRSDRRGCRQMARLLDQSVQTSRHLLHGFL